MTGDFWLGIDTLWKAGGKGPITGKRFCKWNEKPRKEIWIIKKEG